MDKSWIDLVNRTLDEYYAGVTKFIDFAFSNRPPTATQILCPCKKCECRYHKDRETVKIHCIVDGFDKRYKNWTSHGEAYVSVNNSGNQGTWDNDSTNIDNDVRDNMRQMVHEVLGIPEENEAQLPIEDVVQSDETTAKFLKLLKYAESELWEGCEEFTSLSFIVELMHLKAISRWSDKSFTSLLKILKRGMPKSTKLPHSYTEAYKMTADLGFGYKTWDVCINHCMLFRNEYENLDKCKLCGESRYKKVGDGDEIEDASKAKRVAAKKMWYFPLKPRLQRLYWSSKTASLMRWHAEEREADGVLRHPADSLAWKNFDERYPTFASDARNIRLGLASDGFNPFRNMSSSYSVWPVVLIPYNLPPWLCMKQPNFILSVLTQGPKGPGNKIDVYLQPLIDELKELWDGVPTYDASSNEMFTLRASLMWTINDYPAYWMLSAWMTKGEYACAPCNRRPQSQWLKHGGKWSYIGHRRFLHKNHTFRTNKRLFDGHFEVRAKPKVLSGAEVLKQVENIETEYKVEDVLRKRKREEEEKQAAKRDKRKVCKPSHNWKKRSIFFELPYWKDNDVRHNLDGMHIEKNFCDNLLNTILGTGKSKDNLKSRLDLKDMNIRKALHPRPLGSGKFFLPPSQFTMSKKHKEIFLKVLKGVKVPDGYASNISRCVNLDNLTISGLKSHDSHILMQQLLLVAVRKALPKDVVKVVIELANFFRQLCSKVNTLADLEKIQDRIALTLCYLERIFPPSFFDVMEHLPVHLAEEALLAGAIQYRWMYPIERFLLTLKHYVRNRNFPEASIAKGYIAEECMVFCTRYLEDVETRSNIPGRNDDKGCEAGHYIGKREDFTFDYITKAQAHRYVLFNTEVVEPYLGLFCFF